jgi:hypothetical protein
MMAINNLGSAPLQTVAEPKKRKSPTPRPTGDKAACCPHCGQPTKRDSGRRPWSRSEDVALIERLEAGDSHSEIAEDLGRPVTSIRSRIITLGIDLDPQP